MPIEISEIRWPAEWCGPGLGLVAEHGGGLEAHEAQDGKEDAHARCAGDDLGGGHDSGGEALGSAAGEDDHRVEHQHDRHLGDEQDRQQLSGEGDVPVAQRGHGDGDRGPRPQGRSGPP